MQRLTVTLETVTPLFLAGADPRGAPELRPPSFRGLFRYWARVVLGGVVGDHNLADLHFLESAVFGSTDAASPIQLRLRGALKPERAVILPHKTGREAGQRLAFSAGQGFELEMCMRQNHDRNIWSAARATLELALTFGGVGLRSRRGFGTLRIQRTSDQSVPAAPITTVEDWKAYIERVCLGALVAWSELARSHGKGGGTLPAPPTAYPCACRDGLIRIVTMPPKPEERSSTAMHAVTHFMSVVPRDPAFGGISPRQASPLWVRPIAVDRHYTLLLVLLMPRLQPRADYPCVSRFLDSHFPGEDLIVKGWNA